MTQRDEATPVNNSVTAFSVDFFINDTIRANRDLLYRARILALTELFMVAEHIALFLTLLVLPYFEASRSVALPLIAIALSGWSYSLYLLKRSSNYSTCSFVALAQGTAVALIACAVTGGPSLSPVSQILAAPCLAAFFLGGFKTGVKTSALCFATLVIMLIMEAAGFVFPSMVSSDSGTHFWEAAFFTNLMLTAALAIVYELTSSRIRRERDKERQEYITLARTDALTGLPNRRGADEMLAARIALYARMESSRGLALCYLDLDKFKPINDKLGHGVGDEVLSVIGQRLRSILRGADFIGRLGGDEFMILLDEVNEIKTLDIMAARFLQLIEEPVSTSAGMLQVGGSLGFALFPLHAQDAHNLKKAADQAMYEAKRQQSGYRIFTAS